MTELEVEIPVAGGSVAATWTVPDSPRGMVAFAHGSGSSRYSPRNRVVALELQSGGLATLLVDLLTPTEERLDEATGELRFDIPFLAERLVDAIDWLGEGDRRALPLGLFGASTGAAAALLAASHRTGLIRAVVSRGGRPDLAGSALGRVGAPVLLVVGARDEVVVGLNQRALAQLAVRSELVVVPNATHLFPEPGAIERVAALARAWFERHMLGGAAHPPLHGA